MIAKSKIIENGAVNFSNIQISFTNKIFVTFTKVQGGTLIQFFDSTLKILSEQIIEDSYLEFTLMHEIHGFIGDRLNRAVVYTVRDQEVVLKSLNQPEGWCLDDSNYGVSRSYIRVYKFHGGELNLGVFKISEEVIQTNIDYDLHFFEDFAFKYNELNVTRIIPEKLEPLWSKDYTDELDHIEGMNRVINPIIGVHSDIFVFSYQGKWLVGVDITTGEIFWKVRGSWSRSQLLENGNVFVMVGSQMRLLDIKTGELIGEYGEIEGEIGPQRMNYTFIGDHVILTGRPSDTIGAYNTKTYKYDWIYKEEGTQWSPQPMKYYHPYLFVNDTKGNLHVFEVDDKMKLKEEL